MKKILIFLTFVFFIFFLLAPKNAFGVSGADCISNLKCPICGDNQYFGVNKKCCQNGDQSCLDINSSGGIEPISCSGCDISQEYCNLGVGCQPLPAVTCVSPGCVYCLNNFYLYEIRTNFYKCCPTAGVNCDNNVAVKPNCDTCGANQMCGAQGCQPLAPGLTCPLCPTCKTGLIWNPTYNTCCPETNSNCSGISGEASTNCFACTADQHCDYDGKGCLAGTGQGIRCQAQGGECTRVEAIRCPTGKEEIFNMDCGQDPTGGMIFACCKPINTAQPIKPIFCKGAVNENCIQTALGDIPTNPQELITKLLPWLIGLAAGIAFFLMLAGAFQIMTSAGNPEGLKAGQERLTSAIIGLLLVIFAVFLMRIIGIPIINISGSS